jgi:hypothetical protein
MEPTGGPHNSLGLAQGSNLFIKMSKGGGGIELKDVIYKNTFYCYLLKYFIMFCRYILYFVC